jgi:pimeloyl-ACP methyl ester carboxylesterase
MRRAVLTLLALFLAAGPVLDAGAEAEPDGSTYVLVHGAWGGGWAWKDVADRLEQKGHEAYRPTLTGLGERRHLVSTEIGLDTHIQDVVNVLEFEQLTDVVLVGHSYGGMVISGVAERVPDRIRHRVYIDAFVPEDGESASSRNDAGGDDWLQQMTKDGLVVPPWVRPDQPLPHDVPHPLKTFTDTISLKSEAARAIPTTYILTVDPGQETDAFSSQAERARERGWTLHQMETDHNPQWSKPAELVELLQAAPGQTPAAE